MGIQWSCDIPVATITRFCRDTNVATPLHFELPGVLVGSAHDGQGFQEFLELFCFGAGEALGQLGGGDGVADGLEGLLGGAHAFRLGTARRRL